jgi:hypothetical protein
MPKTTYHELPIGLILGQAVVRGDSWQPQLAAILRQPAQDRSIIGITTSQNRQRGSSNEKIGVRVDEADKRT